MLTEFSDTGIRGTVEALEDGFFYTSVPYEPGWHAYVDGTEVPLAQTYDPESGDLKLTDAVIGFALEKGSHEITLRYRAPGLKTGALISAVSLLGLSALWFCLRRRPVLLPDPPQKPAARQLLITENNQENNSERNDQNE